METKVLKIKDLNENLKFFIESSNNFKNINIKGEIANLTYNKSGHIYFSLKDNEAKIDCAIWKSNAQKFINLNPQEGTEVIASGSLSFYKPTGKLTFTIVNVKLDGIGELSIIYDKRYNELKQKGWFDNEIKKNIPKIPKNIGIVTAASGDAVRDLITTARRRYPPVNIYLFPASVQGETAANDIANKIMKANRFHKKLDLLIVGRGGGSYEDLWTFNEMAVLEAIYKSNIPIISAVGHEPDVTLADYVADLRVSTPTAAGERATPEKTNLIQALNNKLKELGNVLSNKINIEKNKILNFENEQKKVLINKILFMDKELSHLDNYLNESLIRKFQMAKTSLNNHINNVRFLFKHNFDKTKNYLIATNEGWNKKLLENYNLLKNNIFQLDEKLDLLNPLKPLEHGFAILKQDEKIIKSVRSINKQNNIEAILIDGKINLKVEN